MRFCSTVRVLAGALLMVVGLTGCRDETSRPERSSSDSPTEVLSPAQADRSELLRVGERAPDFVAVGQDGHRARLASLLERGPVVLIFYPKDFTPGCTKQLCAVRDDWSGFQKRGAAVLGVNPADTQTHAKFAAEYRFPFPVVCDEGSRIAAAYGCRGPQVSIRTVYVIGRDGKVLLADRGFVTHERIFAAIDAQ